MFVDCQELERRHDGRSLGDGPARLPP